MLGRGGRELLGREGREMTEWATRQEDMTTMLKMPLHCTSSRSKVSASPNTISGFAACRHPANHLILFPSSMYPITAA